MKNQFTSKSVKFNHDGRTFETTVIADAESARIHPGASAYLLNKTLSNASPKSVKKYASIIKSLMNEIAFDPNLSDLDDLSDTDMSNYIELVLMKDRNNKAGTVDQAETTLSNFFRFLADQGFTQKGDRFTFYKSLETQIKLAKSQGRNSSHDPFRLSERYMPERQFKLLLSYATGKSSYIKDRNEIILRLSYESGLRAFEITSFNNFSLLEIAAAIKNSDRRNLNEIELNIIGKGNKLRSIVIEPALRRKIEGFIRRYKHVLNGHLICGKNGKELNQQYASTIFRRARKKLILKAKLEDADRWEKNIGWTGHALRHSYATNLAIRIESGEEKLGRSYLMDRLGHNYPKTTVIYLHFACALLGKLRERDQYEEEMRARVFKYDHEEFAA